MKNTLTDLNNYLFEQLERLNDDEMDEEQLEHELKKADAVVKISDAIIHNGELSFKVMKHMDEYGYDRKNRAVPAMLTQRGGE